MKRMLLFLCVFFGGTLTLMSQITGGFYQQNGYVYFMGQNISGGALRNLTIRCVNSVLSQQQTFRMNFLVNGGTFTVGPNDGWAWELGERLIVTYANGQSVYWDFQPVPTLGMPDDNMYYYNNSTSDNMVDRERIRQLESKKRDAERSLRMYEQWNEENPSVSNSQLIISTKRLIRTYENQIQQILRGR